MSKTFVFIYKLFEFKFKLFVLFYDLFECFIQNLRILNFINFIWSKLVVILTFISHLISINTHLSNLWLYARSMEKNIL